MRRGRIAFFAGVTLAASPLGAQASPEEPAVQQAMERLEQGDIRNLYLPFARHALKEATRRQRGEVPRTAVLERNASLVSPRTVDCANKPLAVILDLDIAPGTPAQMEIERQTGFAALLQSLRYADIRIIWLAESGAPRLAPVLALLQDGDDPVISSADLMLVGLPGNGRKQDRRLQLAQNHCILAIAGDRKADFDELYDYLRDQSYAIRLEAFMDRGWFLLPHPVAAIDSERLQISPEEHEVDTPS